MLRKLSFMLILPFIGGVASAGTGLIRVHLPAGGTPLGSADVRAAVSALATTNSVSGNVYVGSEYCLACHNGKRLPAADETAWRGTQHAAAYIRPMTQWTLVAGKGVLANSLSKATDDFMQGLDFNTISSPFDQYKPNAPKIAVKNGGYTITIGALELPVVTVLQFRWSSGTWEQLYCVRVPVGDLPSGKTEATYSSPLFYSTDGGWEAYTPEAWYDAGNQPRYGAGVATADVVKNCESHDQNCVGCHATGMKSIGQNARGEWVFKGFLATLFQTDDPTYLDWNGNGSFTLTNIGCESCHGPGGNHIMGGGDKAKIVNPAKLDAKGANDTCGQCHSVVASAPSGAIGWPYNETTNESWIPGSGSPLESFTTEGEVWWPDGKTGIDTSQYPEFYKSTKPTYKYHSVRCIECHDAMTATSNGAQVVDSITDGALEIPTKVEDDTLCLACHATHAPFDKITKEKVASFATNRAEIGAVVESHTHHPFGPERTMGLSRCTQCHMATTQGPDGALTLRGHTFEAIPPQKTLRYQGDGGMPNSCALSCHATLVNSFGLGLTTDLYSWNKKFDVDLAANLQKYYGPDGLWWKRDIEKEP